MAIYHNSFRIISRSKGRSATAAAAYRAGMDIYDERSGRANLYARRTGVLDHEIHAPNRAPVWAARSDTLWNELEKFENRTDAQLVRENIIALPHELSLEENKAWLKRYVDKGFVSRGMIAQVDIHAPDKDGDNRNLHAHIMLTMRGVTRNGFKAKKARNWNDKATLMEWRELAADEMNLALEQASHDVRVSHKSFKDLGIEDREPTKHQGPAVTGMKRRFEESGRAAENDQIKKRNDEREYFDREKYEAAQEQKMIDAAIEAELEKIAEEEKQRIEEDERQQKIADQQRAAAAKALEAQRRAAEAERQKIVKHEAWQNVVLRDELAEARTIPSSGGQKPVVDAWIYEAEPIRQGDATPEEQWQRAAKRMRGEKETELRAEYKRDETAAALDEARANLDKNRSFWGWITGRRAGFEHQVWALEKNLASADQRIAEQRGALEKDIEAMRPSSPEMTVQEPVKEPETVRPPQPALEEKPLSSALPQRGTPEVPEPTRDVDEERTQPLSAEATQDRQIRERFERYKAGPEITPVRGSGSPEVANDDMSGEDMDEEAQRIRARFRGYKEADRGPELER